MQNEGIQTIVDVVLNHKAGGDEVEKVMAVKIHEEARNEIISEPEEIEAFTKFHFPGREGLYSDFIWDSQCFSGVDYNHLTKETAIFKFLSEYGDQWDETVNDEKGNYDYLLFCDIEFRNPAVYDELAKWGKWYHDTIQFDGVRLDAVKHIPPKFFNEWLASLRKETGKEIFAVGKLDLLLKYIEVKEGNMTLFDSALHAKLHEASLQGSDFNMSSILDDTLRLCPIRPLQLLIIMIHNLYRHWKLL